MLLKTTIWWERPYQHDSTASRLLSEVKHARARLVLRWGTTLESRVLYSFFLFFTHPLMPLLLGNPQRGIVLAAAIHFFALTTGKSAEGNCLSDCDFVSSHPHPGSFLHRSSPDCQRAPSTVLLSADSQIWTHPMPTSDGSFRSPGDGPKIWCGLSWGGQFLMVCWTFQIWSFLRVQWAKHKNPCNLTLTPWMSTSDGSFWSLVDPSNNGWWVELMWPDFGVLLCCWNLVIFEGAKSMIHKPVWEDLDQTNTNESRLILELLRWPRKMAMIWMNGTHPSCIVRPLKFWSFTRGKNQNTQTHTTLAKMVSSQFSFFWWMCHHQNQNISEFLCVWNLGDCVWEGHCGQKWPWSHVPPNQALKPNHFAWVMGHHDCWDMNEKKIHDLKEFGHCKWSQFEEFKKWPWESQKWPQKPDFEALVTHFFQFSFFDCDRHVLIGHGMKCLWRLLSWNTFVFDCSFCTQNGPKAQFWFWSCAKKHLWVLWQPFKLRLLRWIPKKWSGASIFVQHILWMWWRWTEVDNFHPAGHMGTGCASWNQQKPRANVTNMVMDAWMGHDMLSHIMRHHSSNFIITSLMWFMKSWSCLTCSAGLLPKAGAKGVWVCCVWFLGCDQPNWKIDPPNFSHMSRGMTSATIPIQNRPRLAKMGFFGVFGGLSTQNLDTNTHRTCTKMMTEWITLFVSTTHHQSKIFFTNSMAHDLRSCDRKGHKPWKMTPNASMQSEGSTQIVFKSHRVIVTAWSQTFPKKQSFSKCDPASVPKGHQKSWILKKAWAHISAVTMTQNVNCGSLWLNSDAWQLVCWLTKKFHPHHPCCPHVQNEHLSHSQVSHCNDPINQTWVIVTESTSLKGSSTEFFKKSSSVLRQGQIPMILVACGTYSTGAVCHVSGNVQHTTKPQNNSSILCTRPPSLSFGSSAVAYGTYSTGAVCHVSGNVEHATKLQKIFKKSSISSPWASSSHHPTLHMAEHVLLLTQFLCVSQHVTAQTIAKIGVCTILGCLCLKIKKNC